MKSHVFITTKFLDRCLETGLFGVSNRQINYLANVDKDDQVFLLETQSGRIVGPLTVIEPLFYSDTNIWGEKDKYFYRVKINAEEVFVSDISALWCILLKRNNNRFFSFTTYQRSNNTLFFGEGEKLTQYLKKYGTKTPYDLKNNLTVGKIDFFKRDINRFSSEARLETVLLRNRERFLEILVKESILKQKENNFVINQITLPGLNYNIDIAVFNEKQIVLIELKKDYITEETFSQLRRYKKYWRGENNEVSLIALGSKEEAKCKDIISIEYKIDSEKESLKLIINNNEYFLKNIDNTNL